jgi:hypothetical protein
MARQLRFEEGTAGRNGHRPVPLKRTGLRSSLGICETCGSRLHGTASCRHRDDIAFGTVTPSQNGEYRGPLKVRIIPPGWSYAEAATMVDHREIKPQQTWQHPLGRRYIVIRVADGAVHLRSKRHLIKTTETKLRAAWTFHSEAHDG